MFPRCVPHAHRLIPLFGEVKLAPTIRAAAVPAGLGIAARRRVCVAALTGSDPCSLSGHVATIDHVDGAVALGIVGLLTTSGTAIWLRWLDDRRHARQLAHERALADRGELRRLLDEAAGLMRRLMWTHSKMLQAFRARQDELVDSQVEDLGVLAEEGSLMVGRLSLRLGSQHEVTRAYDAMADIFERMSVQLQEALPTGISKYMGNRENLAERLDTILHSAEHEFRPTRRRFLAAAQSYVGADVAALVSGATRDRAVRDAASEESRHD